MKILILQNSDLCFDGAMERRITDRFPDVRVSCLTQAQAAGAPMDDYEVIFGWPTPELLRRAGALRWLHLPSAGVEKYIDPSLYVHPGAILTRSRDVYAVPIAEHVLMMFLSILRQLPGYVRRQERHVWKHQKGAREITGLHVLVLGLGSIGLEVAKKLDGIGCSVSALARTPGEKPAFIDALFGPEDLEQALAGADLIACCLPDTPQTKHIINEARLRAMKKDAILVNIGRGSAVDTQALVKALQNGWIGGAGLDVTEPEPLAEDSPLWDMENVIITPHSSAISEKSPERLFGLFFDLLCLYMEGKPLYNVVDFSRQY